MKNYLKNIVILAKKIFLLLIIFQFCRINFFIFNFEYFKEIKFFELIKIFFYGTKFDISAIVNFNFILIFLHIFPFLKKNNNFYKKFIFYLFFIVNFFLITVNLIDVEYFNFTNKRSDIDIFKLFFISNDLFFLIPQFIKDYFYILILIFIASFSLYFFHPKLKFDENKKNFFSKNDAFFSTLIFIFLFSFFIILSRGGLNLKPIRVISASKYTKPEFIPLILNTPFTLMKTFNKADLKEKNFFNKKEIEKIYSTKRQFFKKNKFQKLNVVIIILESFSYEYIGFLNENGKSYTPFLDSLMHESLCFTNAYANGKKSIEALPAIFASIPALMDNPYITSNFATNKISSLPKILKEENYETSFFHGGKNGTMGFDNFCYILGIEKYFGKDEFLYENKKYKSSLEKLNYKNFDDGNWGIFDEAFFIYFAKKINEFSQPFFTSIFTLSSHHPYNIPEKYKNKFPKGNLKIHESIAYTDFSLKKFFEISEKMSWFENTLFVITADHTAQAENIFFKNPIGKYKIPIIFFKKNSHLKGKNFSTSQHIDIFPSVLDYMNYKKKFFSFGNSLFSKNNKNNFAINYINGIYQFIDNENTLFFDGEKTISFFDIKNNFHLENNLILENENKKLENEKKLKAIIQTYNYKLIHNENFLIKKKIGQKIKKEKLKKKKKGKRLIFHGIRKIK